MMKTGALVAVLLFASFASAQSLEPPVSWTLAIFLSTATNPAIDQAVAPPVVYPVGGVSAPTCGLATVIAPQTVINPTTLYVQDPADTTKVCRFTITAQIVALPPGTYKGAAKMTTATKTFSWGVFSNVFQRALPQVCPGQVTIVVEGYTSSVTLGKSGRVIVNVSSTAPIVLLTAHLAGDRDYSSGPLIDGHVSAGVRYTPAKAGVFPLTVTAVDANGCAGTTAGVRRTVTVKG